MLRKALIDRAGDGERLLAPDGFRLRGSDVSRIEGFSDSVFAFALTLLVVSLEVPKTFDQLQETARGFVSFAVCFALLAVVWYAHYKFFRRYGLHDRMTLVLNLCLLFLILFYVYPLKFLFSMTVNAFVFGRPAVVISQSGQRVPIVRDDQVPALLTYFGVGYAAVFFVFGLMYANALRLRAALGLDRREVLLTIEEITGSALHVLIAAASVVFAHSRLSRGGALAGMMYLLVPILMTINGGILGRIQRNRADVSIPAGPSEAA
jgi:Endosomal/lysosomal potassium channel TMEM175